MASLVRTMIGKNRETATNVVKSTGLNLDFGTMTETGVKLDSFKYEITDYKVLDYLTINKDYLTKTDTSGADSHSHKVITPDELKPLEPGDRVLTAQVGSEIIILGRISS